MFTNSEAERLVEAEKFLEEPNQQINFNGGRFRIPLIAPSEPGYKFFIDVNLNQKIRFKMTLHCQESYSSSGLLRIDYRGSHKNPDFVTDKVPEFLKPYVGMEFRRKSHIHFYIEDYKPLVWAMPLSDHSFKVKQLISEEDYVNSFLNFAKLLHVKSLFNISNVQKP